MKIALIRPNYRSQIITPPLGIGYISSYLKKQGHEVLLIDGLNSNLTVDEIVYRTKNYPVVGITVLTDFFLQAKLITKKLKKLSKIVILGGPHPTVLPKESLLDTGADFVILGEGELTISELIKAIEEKRSTKKIKGLYSKDNLNQFTSRQFVKNLDDLPFPDWEQMCPSKYQKAPHGASIKSFPVAPIITSRGCPYECTFCSSPKLWKRKIRFRSPENVIAEIEYLIKNFGVKEIHFEDDNLTLKRDHIKNICNLIIKKKIKISWATPNGIRADKIDEKILTLMKKSGCYYVAFGIESGNQKILKNIKKHETLGDIEKAIRIASKVGLITQGFFIFGLPGETENTIKNTMKFSKKVPLDRAQFLLLDLLPGTELWEQHKYQYKIDYLKRSFQDTTWVPKTINPIKLKKAQSKAFRQFYFRLKPMVSMIRYLRLSQIKYILNRLVDFRILKFKNNE